MNNTETKSGGINGLTALFLIFLTLKLCDVIAWSWWWVFAPVWMPICFLLGVIVVVLLFKVLTGK